MKIWHYTSLDPNGLGGVEMHIASVTRELRALGHEVHIGLTPPAWTADIVHTHGDAWPGGPLLKRSATRLIHVAHGTTFGRLLACREYFSLSGWKGSLRDLLPSRMAHAVAAVSTQVEGELRRYFRVHQPIKVIANGVDPTIFKPLAAISPAPRVAFVGRGDDRVKNVATLVEACRRLKERHPDLELWAMPGLDATEPFISNRGRKVSSELAHELAQCRALALVSLYESDGIVLREAQALGLPIVASDTPSIRQNIGRYSPALLVDPRSVESVAAALEKILYAGNTPSPSPQLRSWKQVASEFDAFYRELTPAK